MAENYLKTSFPIDCRGRDIDGREVLDRPVRVSVEISQGAGNFTLIESTVGGCPHNTGGHGERCAARYKNGKTGRDRPVSCAWAFDLPYASDRRTQIINAAHTLIEDLGNVLDGE